MADDPAVASWLATLAEVQARQLPQAPADWNPTDDIAEARLDQRDLSGSDADWFADRYEQHVRGEN